MGLRGRFTKASIRVWFGFSLGALLLALAFQNCQRGFRVGVSELLPLEVSLALAGGDVFTESGIAKWIEPPSEIEISPGGTLNEKLYFVEVQPDGSLANEQPNLSASEEPFESNGSSSEISARTGSPRSLQKSPIRAAYWRHLPSLRKFPLGSTNLRIENLSSSDSGIYQFLIERHGESLPFKVTEFSLRVQSPRAPASASNRFNPASFAESNLTIRDRGDIQRTPNEEAINLRRLALIAPVEGRDYRTIRWTANGRTIDGEDSRSLRLSVHNSTPRAEYRAILVNWDGSQVSSLPVTLPQEGSTTESQFNQPLTCREYETQFGQSCRPRVCNANFNRSVDNGFMEILCLDNGTRIENGQVVCINPSLVYQEQEGRCSCPAGKFYDPTSKACETGTCDPETNRAITNGTQYTQVCRAASGRQNTNTRFVCSAGFALFNQRCLRQVCGTTEATQSRSIPNGILVTGRCEDNGTRWARVQEVQCNQGFREENGTCVSIPKDFHSFELIGYATTQVGEEIFCPRPEFGELAARPDLVSTRPLNHYCRSNDADCVANFNFHDRRSGATLISSMVPATSFDSQKPGVHVYYPPSPSPRPDANSLWEYLNATQAEKPARSIRNLMEFKCGATPEELEANLNRRIFLVGDSESAVKIATTCRLNQASANSLSIRNRTTYVIRLTCGRRAPTPPASNPNLYANLEVRPMSEVSLRNCVFERAHGTDYSDLCSEQRCSGDRTERLANGKGTRTTHTCTGGILMKISPEPITCDPGTELRDGTCQDPQPDNSENGWGSSSD